ncbi:hypothetical protein NDU88_004700, partial [Pleurodeles waltl]
GRNIRDKLVHASFSAHKKNKDLTEMFELPPLIGHFKCNNCMACKYTENTKNIEVN